MNLIFLNLQRTQNTDLDEKIKTGGGGGGSGVVAIKHWLEKKKQNKTEKLQLIWLKVFLLVEHALSTVDHKIC